MAHALARGTSEADARQLLHRALKVLPPGKERLLVYRKLCPIQVDVDTKSTLDLAQAGMAEARDSHDERTIASMLNCEGYARQAMGDNRTATRLYTRALSIAKRADAKEEQADALVSLGELRQANGDYSGAIVDLKRSYDLYREIKLDGGVEYALNAIANYYSDSNVADYDKAIVYYRELLARSEKRGDKANTATISFNICGTLESKGAYAQAMEWCQRAYRIDSARKDKDSMALEQREIGTLLSHQGQLDAALAWIDKALAYRQETRDAAGIARARLTRGTALRQNGKPKAALSDLNAALAYFKTTHNDRALARIHKERALAYAALHRWRPAYQALNEQFRLQHELDRKLLEEKTTRLRVEFDAEHTEQLNAALQAENRQRGLALKSAQHVRRLQWLLILLGGLLMAMVFVLAIRQLWRSRRLRALALTDELTGLPNRRNILAFLDQQLDRARHRGHPLSLVLFDVDHFKRINDTFGHDTGDRALKSLASLASHALRASDRIGRYGGEEFALILPDTNVDTAANVAERTRHVIEHAHLDEVAPGIRLTISVGVSAWSGGTEKMETLLKRADEALYAAKEQGRNRVVVKAGTKV